MWELELGGGPATPIRCWSPTGGRGIKLRGHRLGPASCPHVAPAGCPGRAVPGPVPPSRACVSGLLLSPQPAAALRMGLRGRRLLPLLLGLLLGPWCTGSSPPEPCQTCRDLASSFLKGLERTERENFGGGNTAWEEEKLAKYAHSETRLLEVLESVCGKSDFACHQLLEQSEEHVESWWFQGQQQHPDFFQWLCMDMLKVCCPPGTYGPDCLPCAGGHQQPCSGNGKCDGEGTRAGTGLCMCSPGYGGSFCSECADGYYEAARNESHLSATRHAGAAQGQRTPAVCAARGAGRCMSTGALTSMSVARRWRTAGPTSSASTPRAPTSAETWTSVPVCRNLSVPGPTRSVRTRMAATGACVQRAMCAGMASAWRTDPQTPRQRAFLTR
ncbi:protein disulfide isomerase CRELD1 isoform X4 [Caretta caretta]|uniref:protein disulfide isomerase CRELD1 isoform X4 n=1 Tax=Caretta caretta TaxID=8467 RepID=UPI003F4C297C